MQFRGSAWTLCAFVAMQGYAVTHLMTCVFALVS
jgi:hypothetical protein